MFEKVNPMHPEKIADRIVGSIVDLSYKKADNPIAVEVLIGHGKYIIDGDKLVICQSHAKTADLKEIYPPFDASSEGILFFLSTKSFISLSKT